VCTDTPARLPVLGWAPRGPAAMGALLLALAAGPAAAQGLPEYAPVNPVARSRSGLYFQPYREPAPGRLRLDVRLDYGNAIEYDLPQARPSYLLDGEFLRFQVAAARDLRPDVFVFGEASVEGAYGGFLDGFINWYHNLWGFKLPERAARPNDASEPDTDGCQACRQRSRLRCPHPRAPTATVAGPFPSMR
jgi:hypothetical protein